MKTCTAFKKLSAMTWRTIDRTSRNGIKYGEDAITSVVLDGICSSGLRSVVVDDFRPIESKTGCDFELWLGSNRADWRRYAVQAKKISVATERYHALNHYTGGVTQQHLVLTNYAAANRALPIYALYNWSAGATPTRRCVSSNEEWGISLTPVARVRQALSGYGFNKFAWFHAHSDTIPWHCLVCHGASCGPGCLSAEALQHWAGEHTYRELPQVIGRLFESRSDVPESSLVEFYKKDNSEGLLPRNIVIVDTADG